MKKRYVFILLLFGLLFYKEELAEQYDTYFPQEEETADWVSFEGDRLYRNLETYDFDNQLELLADFEKKIQNELVEVSKSTASTSDEDGNNSYKGKLICQLAVVYQKTAMWYLQHGQEMVYVEYMQKYQDALVECADLRLAAQD